MAIDFKNERWQEIKKNYSKWWRGELERPLLPVYLTGKDPERDKPKYIYNEQIMFADLTITPEEFIDSFDYELSTRVFLGDGFPFLNMMCSGPGIVAAFLGSNLDCSTGRIWFSPNQVLPLSKLHFEYDANNIWLNRVKDICKEANKRWQGQVLVGMPDLGGVIDILASFRMSDNLLMDLIDEPDEVKRLTWEIYELWHRYFNEINEVLQPTNPGYSDWAQIYSDVPSYVPQCDFCYMISTDMFNEFVKPELEATFNRIPRTLYHLDGVGQLNHLDSLLTINGLNAVQWVPGDGKPKLQEWPEVYKKIYAAGKKIQIYTEGFPTLDKIAEQIGTYKGIHQFFLVGELKDQEEMKKVLLKYGE